MVVVVMRRRADRIGSAFGLERRFDRRDLAAERWRSARCSGSSACRRIRFGKNLHRHMTIAERPGDTRKHVEFAANFDQRLGRSNHVNEFAGVEHQHVIGAQ